MTSTPPTTATATATASPHLAVRPQWLALQQEPVMEPDLPIVDAHHHLWDHAGNRYFATDMLEDLATGHNVRATVAVECHAMYNRRAPAALQPVGEVEFLNGSAALSASGQYGPCQIAAAIVGHADLLLGADVLAVLQAQMRAGGDRLRGIRYSAVWHPDPQARGSLANPPPHVMNDPRFRQGFARLAPLGLSFDAWIYHTQITELAALARQFPQTSIVVNHAGGVIGIGPYAGRRDAVRAEWATAMRDLASCENVFVKLGGMGMRLFGFDLSARARPPSSQELADLWAPYVHTCIELFGADRCMFESNFPVDKGSCSYAVLWNAFKRMSSGASAAEKQALFSGTAARVYRLTLDTAHSG